MTAKANRLVRDSGMMEFLHTHASPLGVLVTASIATSMATQITPGPNNVIMLLWEKSSKKGMQSVCTPLSLYRTTSRPVRCPRRRILSPEIRRCRILIPHVRGRNFSPRQTGRLLTRKCRYWLKPCHIPAPR